MAQVHLKKKKKILFFFFYSGSLAKFTDSFQLSTQQMFQVVSTNSTKNATFNDFCFLKIIQPLQGNVFST